MDEMTAPASSTAGRLQRWEHAPVDDRPYYDVERDVPQSYAHDLMVVDLVSIPVQLALNECDEVPEFALFFPELEDPRSLDFSRMVEGRYEELKLSPGAEVAVGLVPGLVFRVKPRAEWRRGDEIEIFYRGELQRSVAGEPARAEATEERTRALEAELAALRRTGDAGGN